MKIREATKKDFEEIWPIFNEIVSAGETYAYPVETDKEEAEMLWLQLPRKTYVTEDEGRILWTYYIKQIRQNPETMYATVGTWFLQKQEAEG